MFATARTILLICLCIQICEVGAIASEVADADANSAQLHQRGYEPLFNGKDLTGWRNPYDHGEAKVVNEEIHLVGNKKFFLVTDNEYSDFRLVVDIKLPEGRANSGVMFRCHVQPNRVYGYQAECDGSDRRWSGGLYDEGRRQWIWPSTPGRSEPEFLKHQHESVAFFAQPTIRNLLKRDDWNRYIIECRENRIIIELNGTTVTDFQDPVDVRGHIGVQHHGEKGQVYRFKNLLIKELPVVPAEGVVSLKEQEPKKVRRLRDGAWLVDFGRAAFGNLELRPGADASGEVTVHFGEKLNGQRVDRTPPGSVRYYNAAAQLMGSQPIIVAPPREKRNTQQGNRSTPPAAPLPSAWGVVTPFRWVEIEGYPGELEPSAVVRRAFFSTQWDDDAASFECSDELVNDVWKLCKHSIKATTFAGVYVDGDRERIPYEADAYLNQLSHYYTDTDVQMARKTFDWLLHYPTWPTEWAPHMVFIAHADWLHTGNREWLASRYESLKTKTLEDRLGPDGLIHSEKAQIKDDIVDWPRAERDGFEFTEVNTVVNAFHIAAMGRMAEMARAVRKPDDAEHYERSSSVSRSAFQATLFNESTGLYVDGAGAQHSSLHANLFPLAFGLVPEEKRPAVIQWLTKRGMRCSVYAAQYLLEGLFEHGAGRDALSMMIADNQRSWRHMLENDATITWEAWNETVKPNLDWNHAWGAAPANLLPRYVLGVQAAEPGWSRVLIAPHPSGLQWARGKTPTPKGPVFVEWQRGDSFQVRVKLPPGMVAEVRLPPQESGAAEVFVNGARADYDRGASHPWRSDRLAEVLD